MKNKDLIKAGKLAEARANLVATVKQHPRDTASRTLLFQVLLFLGEWDKAERHLEMVADLDPVRGAGLALYKNLLQCERERLEVAAGRAIPSFLPATPNYFEDYYQGCRRLQNGVEGGSGDPFQELGSRLPQVGGTVNGVEFSGLRNTDDGLALALEVFAHDRYCWVPFESIREIIVTAPQTMLDLLWISASITTWGGLALNGFLPVLYPETWKHDNEELRLGRLTEWSTRGGGLVRGVGQQVFVFGEQDRSILELREIRFKMMAAENPSAAA